eukprot:4105430-Pleurochrysis_carterae.AAC.1
MLCRGVHVHGGAELWMRFGLAPPSVEVGSLAPMLSVMNLLYTHKSSQSTEKLHAIKCALT